MENNFFGYLCARCAGAKTIINYYCLAANLPGPECLTAAEITPKNLHSFRKLMLESKEFCRNSAAQYMAQFRTFLNEVQKNCIFDDLKPFDWNTPLAIKQLRSHGVFLNNDRLHELEQFSIPADTRRDLAQSMRIAQLLALISSRTGARASDVMRLTPSNIRGGLLTYVPKKTKDTSGKVCVVPVGPKTTAWIEEVAELSKSIDMSTDKAEKAFYVRYERTLKTICSLMQVEEWDEQVIVFEQNEQKVKTFRDCITSHTLRHSFATNMYLDEEVGGDIYAIAQMLGHSSVDMTMTYICVPFNEKKMAKVKYFE